MNEFLSGVLYSLQILIISHDEPSLASSIVKGSGYSLKDFLEEQKKTGYETRKMNKFLRECFR